uniref:Actin-associated protein FAM107A n=1 Tax=Takifugu rubripes TaxID=31033 RepID=A0A3B5KG26_TAKRU
DSLHSCYQSFQGLEPPTTTGSPPRLHVQHLHQLFCDNLIRPQKPLSPLKASKSHRELHKELRMTHTRSGRRRAREKSELQRALEKRRWEQRIKASRDQDEETKKRSPLYQELTKRHQRLEMLEGERRQQQEGPEFLRVRERLRKIPVLDLGE